MYFAASASLAGKGVVPMTYAIPVLVLQTHELVWLLHFMGSERTTR